MVFKSHDFVFFRGFSENTVVDVKFLRANIGFPDGLT